MSDAPIVTALHVAKASRLPMRAVPGVDAEAGKGIVGDRYHGTRHRHVSVQSQDALDAATDAFGSPVPAALTRRNVTVSHGDVPTAPGTRIRIGGTLLEVVREQSESLDAPAPLVHVTGYGDAGATLAVTFWASRPRVAEAKTQLFVRALQKMAAAGIALPAPQRRITTQQLAAPSV